MEAPKPEDLQISVNILNITQRLGYNLQQIYTSKSDVFPAFSNMFLYSS